ncbi:MAG: hypothetical protein HRT73_03820 [Flavobacteriales bacterium]|nr:hypothetical protein [Flavobacteriales bacterium]
MRKLFIILVVSIAAVGCGNRPTKDIKVTQLNDIVLSTDSSSNVHSLHLSVKGYLNGTADIFAGYADDYPYDSVRIDSGEVDLIIHNSDYYSDTCIVFYRDIDVEGGELTLEYEFHKIDKLY